MPIDGKWMKTNERWMNTGNKKVKEKMIPSNERKRIKEKCEKRYLQKEKVIQSKKKQIFNLIHF